MSTGNLSGVQGSGPVASESIPIEEFRTILIWPLTLAGNALRSHAPEEPQQVAKIVYGEAARLDRTCRADWEHVRDPLNHLPREVFFGDPKDAPKPRQEPYAEFVYFHDFVQRFLYARDETDFQNTRQPIDRAFYMFRHKTVSAVDVGIGDRLYHLMVDRLNLYLFRTGVAILALELSGRSDCAKGPGPSKLPGDKLSLGDAQSLLNRLRRAYTPYFVADDENRTCQPGEVIKSWRWIFDKPSAPTTVFNPLQLHEEIQRLNRSESREPPVFGHWRAILPLGLLAYPDEVPKKGVLWRHVLDERIPVMCFVRMTGNDAASLRAISEGDWARLCFCDEPGGGSLPYAPDFLKDFDERNAYDRFRHWGTRHLFSGYAYVVVSVGTFARDILVQHFRHMYFQMALIAHLEFASYIVFSSRVSEAVEEADRDPAGVEGARFRKTMLAIQSEFLQFIHRFRFTGVSNQLQAREMYDLFRKHLGLHELFKDVKDELDAATSYIYSNETDQQTQSAVRLNVIAALAVVLGLATSALGMNVIVHQDFWKNYISFKWADPWFQIGLAGGVTFIFAASALVMYYLLVGRKERRRPPISTLKHVLWILADLALIAAVLGLVSARH